MEDEFTVSDELLENTVKFFKLPTPVTPGDFLAVVALATLTRFHETNHGLCNLTQDSINRLYCDLSTALLDEVYGPEEAVEVDLR